MASIAFRAPSGKRITRRFLKTDSIKVLYDYLRTVGGEALGFDNEDSDFQLLQPMPRKVFEEDASATLESKGLAPQALLTIKEIE